MTAGEAAGDADASPVPVGPSQPHCDRCGSFAALREHASRWLCDECIERLLHRIEKTPVTALELLRGVLALLGAIGPRAAAVVVVVELPLVLLSLVGTESSVVPYLYGFVALLGTGLVIQLALQHLDGHGRVSVREAASVAARRWPGLVGASVLSGIIVFLFTLLLVVPGVVRALSYAIILPLVVAGDARPVEALEVSRRRMHGHRSQAFLAYLIVWAPPIASFGLYALIDHLLSARYPYAVWEQEIPLPLRLLDAVYTATYPILELPVVLTAVVLYAKLRRRSPGRHGTPVDSEVPPARVETDELRVGGRHEDLTAE